MNITVIAYKPNNVDTCRGCVMDSYDSDLQVFSSDKPEAVQDFIVRVKMTERDTYESGYDFAYLVDGREISSDDIYVREDFTDQYVDMSDAEELINGIILAANDEISALKIAAEHVKKAAEARAAAAAQEARRTQELAQLRALQEKYGA